MFVGWLNNLVPLKMASGFVGKSRFREESFKTQQIPFWVLPTLDAYHVRGWITLWQYHYSSLINSLPVHHGLQILDTQSKEGLIILKVTMFLRGLKNEKSAYYFSYMQYQKKSWKKMSILILSHCGCLFYLWYCFINCTNLFLQPTDTLNDKIKLSMNIENIMHLSCRNNFHL